MSCKIPKKHRTLGQLENSCHIRVGAEQYQSILNLCDETGRSITDVATRLLEFALTNVEVTDAE